MSRTYKDKPSRVRFPNYTWRNGYDVFEYELEKPHLNWQGNLITNGRFYLKRAGFLSKKRRRIDTEWRWQSTPSWWTREFMNRPARKYGNRLAREVTRLQDQDLIEDFDIPFTRKKPHIYYW